MIDSISSSGGVWCEGTSPDPSRRPEKPLAGEQDTRIWFGRAGVDDWCDSEFVC